MTEENAPKGKQLVQVTSVDVLLDNDIRVTWQGFRPKNANKKNLTEYYATIPGDGFGSTTLSMVELGAQAQNAAVGVTLLNGVARLDGKPLELNQEVLLPGAGGGEAAQLEFTSETCSLKVCPKSTTAPEPPASGAATEASGGGDSPPPPPYPGGNNNN